MILSGSVLSTQSALVGFPSCSLAAHWTAIAVRTELMAPNPIIAGLGALTLRVLQEFAVITEQADFFSGSFTCIVGLAYPSIARGGITPYFTQLVDNRKTQDLFSLQFCFTPTAFTWSWASDGYVVNSHGQRVSVDTSGDGSATSLFPSTRALSSRCLSPSPPTVSPDFGLAMGFRYAGAAFMMWEDCPTCPVAAASDGTLNNTAVRTTPFHSPIFTVLSY